MHTILLAPGRYLQGPAALQALPAEAERLGRGVALMLDDFAARQLLPRLTALFDSQGGLAATQILTGANSEANACQHAATLRAVGARVLIGVGGGKVLDAAKAAAELADCSLILVPTAASTDAPCSAVAVMQTDEGRFSHYRFLRRSPSTVLVDTTLIASAPSRMLVAGMGDALSTWFEAEEACVQGWRNVAGSPPARFALYAARQCYDTVIQHGLAAIAELSAGQPGEAFEHVVEANILLSGIGFESGGLGTAHAIQNGLSTLAECRGALHGELVTIGLLAMLRLSAEAAHYAKVRDFAACIGLPVRLAEIGLAAVCDDTLHAAAVLACTPAPMNRVAAGIEPAALVAALRGLA